MGKNKAICLTDPQAWQKMQLLSGSGKSPGLNRFAFAKALVSLVQLGKG